jgi:hypothetical protein
MPRKALIICAVIVVASLIHTVLPAHRAVLEPVHNNGHVVSEEPPDTTAEQASRQETLRLLRTENYADLDKKMNGLQEAYEQGLISDESLLHAFRAFYDADPGLEGNYRAWVAAYPKSYAAHLAHATYDRILAAQARGGKYRDETPQARFDEMDKLLDKAMEENEASVSLTSKPLLTFYSVLWVAGHYEGDDYRKLQTKMLSQANMIDPKNFVVRYQYLHNSQTRWGGSLQRMLECRDEAVRAGLSDTQLALFDKLIAKEQNWLLKNR